MLSDVLSEMRWKLLDAIEHYSKEPWDDSYPGAQMSNLIAALTHLEMARAAYDSGHDNKVYTDEEKNIIRGAVVENIAKIKKNN